MNESNYWAVAHLRFPPGPDRDEARRAVALNFCTHAETGLNKDWEKHVDAVIAKLRGDTVENVVMLTKPKPPLAIVPNHDNTG